VEEGKRLKSRSAKKRVEEEKERKEKLKEEKKNPHLDVDALDHHLPRLQQHLGHHADLALVGTGDYLHGVSRLDVDRLEDGLAVGGQRRRLPLLAGALKSKKIELEVFYDYFELD
jgi:hypothetical protein